VLINDVFTISCLTVTCLRYENKGVQWLKSRPVGPIGLAADESSQSHPDRLGSVLAARCGIPSAEAAAAGDGMSKAAKKNIKRREKKKEKMGNDSHVDRLADDVNTVTLSTSASKPTSADDNKPKEQIRQLRALRKKLKQIVELQARRDAGEKLEPEQLDKIGRRQAIEEEIEYLEIEFSDN